MLKPFIAIVSMLLISSAQAAMTGKDYDLLEIATNSLEANIERFEQGAFLTAGRNHFKTFWTRDFCWSSRGLLLSGNEDVVRDHISNLLELTREDGLVPKVLDSMDPVKRVLNHSLSKYLPWIPKTYPITGDLEAYFVDESNSTAIDSNMMVLLAAIAYVKKTGDEEWFLSQLDKFVKIYRYYDDHLKDGLIYQTPFSDWQDSVKRKGFTFLTNLIYYVVSRDLFEIEEFKIGRHRLNLLRKKIKNTFYDKKSGLFKSMKDHPYISLDGNLFALEHKFLSKYESKKLYQALKKSRFFEKKVGWNTYPNYPYSWRSLATRVAFLPYHDRVYWSWLMAYAGKVAFMYGDQEKGMEIYKQVMRLVMRDQVVEEIYHFRTLKPWKTFASRSEAPFSWGSAFIIDMINTKIKL